MTCSRLPTTVNDLPDIYVLLGLGIVWVFQGSRTEKGRSQAESDATAAVTIAGPLFRVILCAKTDGVEFEQCPDLFQLVFVDEFLAEHACQLITGSDGSLQQ